MRHLIPVLLFTAALTGACGILPGVLPEIPRPTAQLDPLKHKVQGYAGLLAPRQRAWNWDTNRWFEAEVENDCNGYIYLVDQAKGINGYVGDESAPIVSFSSDDPEVVFGAMSAWGQLIFSTDGGRHFVREVRDFPVTRRPTFIALRKGYVYVGMPDQNENFEGYFTWNARGIGEHEKGKKFSGEKLVLLEGKLDKVAGRIGNYMILLPKNYRYRYGRPSLAEQTHIKRIDEIDSLNLPQTEGARARDACNSSMTLPPWNMMWTHKDLVEFVTWYTATKQANPGWVNEDRDKVVERLKKKYGDNE